MGGLEGRIGPYRVLHRLGGGGMGEVFEAIHERLDRRVALKRLSAETASDPQLVARFVLNRCGARTVIARETAETLADYDPPLLASVIGQRVVFADAAQTGRLASEIAARSPAAREIAALAAEVGRLGIGRASA